MPSFISNGGEWYAANEKAVNRETGDVYEGKDREASAFIAQETGGASDHIGIKAAEDPQMMEVARQHGLTIEQWMERNKPTPQQVKIQKDAQAEVVTHKDAPKKQAVSTGTKGGFIPDGSDHIKEFNKKD